MNRTVTILDKYESGYRPLLQHWYYLTSIYELRLNKKICHLIFREKLFKYYKYLFHRSRTKNMMWYGVLGTKELLHRTYKNLEQRVLLEVRADRRVRASCERVRTHHTPGSSRGPLRMCAVRRARHPPPQPAGHRRLEHSQLRRRDQLLGRHQRRRREAADPFPTLRLSPSLWLTSRACSQTFAAPSFDDKILEVVAVFGSMQMAVSRVINLQHHRIAQVGARASSGTYGRPVGGRGHPSPTYGDSGGLLFWRLSFVPFLLGRFLALPSRPRRTFATANPSEPRT